MLLFVLHQCTSVRRVEFLVHFPSFFLSFFWGGIQNTQEIKERHLIGRNRTKPAYFRGSPLFQATYNIKTEKTTTVNSTYLVSFGCGRLAEGKWHETDLCIGCHNCIELLFITLFMLLYLSVCLPALHDCPTDL